eukprot:CAMPEP_0182478462 /NCGR_PEP_ID=MMETSP1319-20130603/32533_1 /TAXON_ID=172717 /ORGANISM="Bolidomonas pacifica, Strain RCC208" /LENGTH=114 /DNA_ID=CAMNT_0024679805 /DNA_START=285 /DNA_END=626 /DNA_ORIENTATION=-
MESKIKEDLDRIAWTSEKLKETSGMGGDGDETSQNKIAADTSKKLDYLTADITEIQADISSLLTKLNTTNEELTKAEEKIDETEQELEIVKVKDEANKIISDMKEGKIKIDYET